jgi:hypothetical protein
VPQKRQGVFFHSIPPEDESKFFQAPKLIPGKRVAAAAAALFSAKDLMNDLLVILMGHSFSIASIYLST